MQPNNSPLIKASTIIMPCQFDENHCIIMKLRCILTCFVLIYGHYLVDSKFTLVNTAGLAGLTNFLQSGIDPCQSSITDMDLSRLTQILNNVFNQYGITAVSLLSLYPAPLDF